MSWPDQCLSIGAIGYNSVKERKSVNVIGIRQG